MQSSRQTFRLFALCCLALLAACGSEPEAETDAPVQVEVAAVQRADANRTLTAVGTVRFRDETPLGFTTPGKIATVRFEEGQRVSKGALLAALDTTNVQADLASARAELDRANARYERIRTLFDQGWVTRDQLEQTEAAAKAAQAQVNAAGFASSTSRITAPSSGIILSRNAEPGQIVAAGTTILVLGKADRGFVVEAPMPDSEVARLSVGMPAKVKLRALEGETIDAQISEIDGRADALSGSFQVSIALDNDPRLRSGQIASVEILVPKDEDAVELAVPPSALFDIRAGEGFVYVVDGKTDTVKARNVDIGRLGDDKVTITGGLRAGEVIVVTGTERLVDGAKIAPQRPSTSKSTRTLAAPE